MSVFQIITLLPDALKVRWQEPYVTQGLNQKALAAQPRGVVAGFTVAPNFGYIVDVLPDPVLGLSIANVLETTGGKYSLTIFQTSPIQVDLTAQAGSSVFLAIDAQYAVGSPSGSQIKVVDAAELLINPDLVVIAKVDVPASPPILSVNNGYAQVSGAALPLPARAPYNMVLDGTFESDANGGPVYGWTQGGGLTVTASTDFAHIGTKSMKIVIVAPGNTNVTTGPVPVTPGEKYTVGAWMRTAAGGLTGIGYQLRVRWLDRSFAALSTENIEGTMTGVVTTFVERRAQVTAPANAAHAELLVFIDASTNGTGYVDDVEFSTARTDTIARSPVFGGPSVVADQYHTHTSGGMSYAGGPPWADGTTNPGPVTIEAQLDKILTDLGGVNGAAKIGFTPVSPLDLTAVRVDTALNQLDDLKAGINLVNTFTNTNNFDGTTNFTKTANFTPSVLNSGAIVATGNGTGVGVQASGGNAGVLGTTASAAGSGVQGAVSNAAGTGAGVTGITFGTGNGVQGASVNTGAGVFGTAIFIGVRGTGILAPGVQGEASAATADAGVRGMGFGTAHGVRGVGTATGVGVKGEGGIHGVSGVGTSGNGIGVFGQGIGSGSGISGLGGGTVGIGVFGAGLGNGQGVWGQGNGSGTGVVGIGGVTGFGMSGTGGAGSNKAGGVYLGGTPNGNGIEGTGQGAGTGTWGLANGATATGAPLGTGVAGVGGVGGWFVSNTIGINANGIRVMSGLDGNGGVFDVDINVAAAGTAAVLGTFPGTAVVGYGVRGVSNGFGAGIRGEASDPGATAGSFAHGGGGFGLIGTGAAGALLQGSSLEGLRVNGPSAASSAIRCDGYINMHLGANPDASDAFANVLTKANVCKAWACITFSQAGIIVLVKGFNISGVGSSGTGRYFVNFAQGIAIPNRVQNTNITYAGAGSTWTITVVAGGFVAQDVGNSIRISGMTNAGNNGDFRITGFTSSTVITISNNAGVAEGPTAGTWVIFRAPGTAHIQLEDWNTTSLRHARIETLRPASCDFVTRDFTGAAVNVPNQVHMFLTVFSHQY